MLSLQTSITRALRQIPMKTDSEKIAIAVDMDKKTVTLTGTVETFSCLQRIQNALLPHLRVRGFELISNIQIIHSSGVQV